jgi:hypothetical protein
VWFMKKYVLFVFITGYQRYVSFFCLVKVKKLESHSLALHHQQGLE